MTNLCRHEMNGKCTCASSKKKCSDPYNESCQNYSAMEISREGHAMMQYLIAIIDLKFDQIEMDIAIQLRKLEGKINDIERKTYRVNN